MMDLRSLRYIVILARRLSYARAAEDLGISQPALTRAVQVIEQRFGVRLFDRDRAGVRLTAHGRTMVEAARVLVANAEDLEREWDRSAKGKSGVVRFGMAPMPARALLTLALRERLQANPGVRNDILVRNVEALWPLLIAGELEFFIAAEGQVPDTPPVRQEVLGWFPISLIVRRGHPLLVQEGDAGKFPVLVSSRSGLAMPADLQRHADGPPHVLEDFATLADLTATSDAIWQSSTFAVAGELQRGLLCDLPRPVDAFPHDLRIMMYSLDRRSQSPSAQSLKLLFRRRITALAEP